MNSVEALEAKAAQTASGASGLLSFLGGYNVCHSLCMALVAGLALIGVSVQGLPLAFLLPYAVPLWLLGIGMLAVVAWFFFTRKCISRDMMAANVGLLIAGTPFKEIGSVQPAFWVFGFGLVGVALYNHSFGRGSQMAVRSLNELSGENEPAQTRAAMGKGSFWVGERCHRELPARELAGVSRQTQPVRRPGFLLHRTALPDFSGRGRSSNMGQFLTVNLYDYRIYKHFEGSLPVRYQQTEKNDFTSAAIHPLAWRPRRSRNHTCKSNAREGKQWCHTQRQ